MRRRRRRQGARRCGCIGVEWHGVEAAAASTREARRLRQHRATGRGGFSCAEAAATSSRGARRLRLRLAAWRGGGSAASSSDRGARAAGCVTRSPTHTRPGPRAVLALGGCAHALGGLRGEAACPRLGCGVGHARFFTTTAFGPGGGGETLRPRLRAVANW